MTTKTITGCVVAGFCGGILLGAAGLASPSAHAADLKANLKTNEVVVVTWGGTLQKSMTEAIFDPFSEATGIRVRQDTGPQIARSRAEVQSGNPSYDVTATNQTFYLTGVEQGLWEPMDYQYFDEADRDAMPKSLKLSHGVAAYIYAHGMNINTKAFPPDKPQPNSWADFWNVDKFPGKRTLAACGSATRPVPEAALLADGVPPDKLYPIDIQRAVRKLKEIAPNVIWWENANQPGQLLASGEVVMAMAPTGRIQKLIDGGAPLKIVWNQSQYTFDAWYVLKGARNADNAMRLIAYAMRPEVQAKIAELSSLAPSNSRAMDVIGKEVAEKLPTHPAYFKLLYKKDDAWWLANRDKWSEACLQAIMG
jgi:putative spermidine/putrescine transport system substrate-binding protein